MRAQGWSTQLPMPLLYSESVCGLPLFPLLPRKRSCEVELILKRHEVRDSLLPPTFGCLRYKRSVFTPHPPGNTGRSLCLSSMPLRHGAL